MAEWHHITIDSNLVEYNTESASLIKMPSTTVYHGYKFWHPAKCMFQAKGNISLAYTDDFTFRLKKYSKGKDKRSIVEECEISGADFADVMEGHIPQIETVLPLEHIPEKLMPVKTVADKDLIDD